MDRSRRLTDGTRWRTFMRLLRLDDLIAFYTNARPRSWPPRGGSRPRHGLRTPRVTVPHLADVARLVYQPMALGKPVASVLRSVQEALNRDSSSAKRPLREAAQCPSNHGANFDWQSQSQASRSHRETQG